MAIFNSYVKPSILGDPIKILWRGVNVCHLGRASLDWDSTHHSDGGTVKLVISLMTQWLSDGWQHFRTIPWHKWVLNMHYINIGWWFGTWLLWLSIQLGISIYWEESSSQLTNKDIYRRGRLKPPSRVIRWLVNIFRISVIQSFFFDYYHHSTGTPHHLPTNRDFPVKNWRR